jgi:hypothetical protein
MTETEFEPITDGTPILPSKRRATVVRTGVWKFRVSSGGMGRAGKRKARGWHKGAWKTGYRSLKKAEEKK